MYEALQWVFAQTALGCFVAIAVLAAINASDYHALEIASSVIDAALGLPSATLSDALSYPQL